MRYLYLFLIAVILLGTQQITPAAAAPAIAAQDNNIWWNDIGHNSRDALYRSPAGAVPTGTSVRLRLRAASGDLTAAQVRIWNDRTDTSSLHNMTRVATGVALPGDPGPYEFWEVTLPASALPTVYWYRFIVTDGTATAYYEDDSAKTGGWGQTFGSSPDNSYQLTIYDPAFTTPDWVKNGVIYQVFADRFRNGNVTNDPTAGGFFYGANDTIVRSNSTDWNTPICDPRAVAGAVAACANKYSHNFYGGDLQGLIDELDYLDSLGVTVIYLNPIFESPSNHKYDTTNYGIIDDNFGDLSTFETLAAQAHAKGMKIVLDGVFNHVSSDSPYLDRYSRFPETGACESQTSPYRNWFYFTDVPAGTGTCVSSTGVVNGATYESWFGYDSLPKLRANTAAVRQLIWDSSSPSTTEGIARYWLDHGADGWRLDVGGDVDPGVTNDPTNNYWEGFRSAVHASKSDGYIVGEEWGNASPWLLGPEWDATMNYQFSAAVLSFWRDEAFTDNDFNTGSSAGPLNPLDANGLNERLLSLQERYAPEAFAAMMNLFGSHDTNRAMFLLDHNAEGNNTALYANPAYDWSDAMTRLKGAALVQMTMPGAPTIYYGDEIGLVGPPSYDGSRWQDDPYNRQPYPWLDASGTPYYTHLQSGGARDQMLAYYQQIIAARNSNAALRTGSLDPLLTSNSNVYVYGRKLADDSNAAIVAVNKGASAETVVVDVSGYIPAGASLHDLLSAATFTVDGSGQLTLTNVPARNGYLLVLDTGFAGSRPAAPSITSTPANGQVTVNWSTVSGAASYDVYRSRLSGGGYTLVGNTASTNYVDSGLSNSTRYYYMVVARSASLLESPQSNETSAIPSYTVGWANLQWPPTINHTRSIILPTVDVYGQVWISGATDASGSQVPGVIAQVGYGDDGTLPTHPSWQWFNASFNSGSGGASNDEYVGSMIVDSPAGNYDYLYRYSTDGGVSWVYGAYNYTFYATLGSYDPNNAGQMTVTVSSDTTAPAAPTGLAVSYTSNTSVALSWATHPNTDGDLYGFEIWRKNLTASEPAFTKIKLLAGATANSYTDGTVTTNNNYEYYIVAVDTSINLSGESNHVTATAETRMVDVTFNATVPAGTPGPIYLAGSFGGFVGSTYPSWNPGAAALAMTESSPNVWSTTLSIPDGYNLQYKYARGTWEKVEKQADGNTEVDNRNLTISYGTNGTQTVNNTIVNWRDPLVGTVSPASSTSDAPSAVISATWSQSMPATINPAGCFAVSGPGGAVAGTVSYNATDKQYTFTPSANLSTGTYNVTIAGCTDSGGDTQQVNKSWSFNIVATNFGKTTPGNNASGQPSTPSLNWSASANATSYEYCVDETNDNACDGNAWVSTASTNATPSLATNKTYYWQVRAKTATNATTYANSGTWWKFTTMPGGFAQISPTPNKVGVSPNPSLSWAASSGAIGYEYCVDTSNNGNCDTEWLTASGTSATPSLAINTVYYWQVRALSPGGGTTYAYTGWWKFSTMPGAFAQISPTPNKVGVSLNPSLSWAASSGAIGYEYCVDTSNNGNCDTEWVTASGTSATPSLAINTVYYWQVRALGAGGSTTYAYTGWWKFSTMPGAFAQISPTPNKVGVSPNPILSWSASSGAIGYEYCVDTSNNSNCDTEWVTASGTSATPSLAINTVYYWQVRALGAGGSTTYAYTGWWKFSTMPGAFARLTPSNGATNQSLTPTLSWSASSGATSYEVCYSTTAGVCNTWASVGNVTSYLISGPLTAGTTYYWQVRALGPDGSITYANATTNLWSFKTAP